jgi:uncharacterized protein (TIRG00374 family)
MSAAKSVGKYAFSLSVLAAILYLIGATDVYSAVAGVDPSMVILAIGLALASQAFSAVRLNQLVLLQDISLTLLRVLLIGLSAVFYGLLVPGGSVAAFAMRFVKLSREARVESVAAALIMDRVIATVFLIAIGITAISFDRAEPFWAITVAVGTLLTVGVFLFGRRVLRYLLDWLESASSRDLSTRLRDLARRIGRAFAKYLEADGRQISIIAGATLMAHLCGCLVYFTIAESLDLNVTLLSICWIRSGIILATMIPVSVAGVGLREVAAIILLVPIGTSEAQAVGFSILILLVTPLGVGLIGGVAELYRVIRLN